MITPYWFRHWFAMYFYEATGDIAAVSEALHHARIETTMTYAKASGKRVRAAHTAAFGN